MWIFPPARALYIWTCAGAVVGKSSLGSPSSSGTSINNSLIQIYGASSFLFLCSLDPSPAVILSIVVPLHFLKPRRIDLGGLPLPHPRVKTLLFRLAERHEEISSPGDLAYGYISSRAAPRPKEEKSRPGEKQNVRARAPGWSGD